MDRRGTGRNLRDGGDEGPVGDGVLPLGEDVVSLNETRLYWGSV